MAKQVEDVQYQHEQLTNWLFRLQPLFLTSTCLVAALVWGNGWKVASVSLVPLLATGAIGWRWALKRAELLSDLLPRNQISRIRLLNGAAVRLLTKPDFRTSYMVLALFTETKIKLVLDGEAKVTSANYRWWDNGLQTADTQHVKSETAWNVVESTAGNFMQIMGSPDTIASTMGKIRQEMHQRGVRTVLVISAAGVLKETLSTEQFIAKYDPLEAAFGEAADLSETSENNSSATNPTTQRQPPKPPGVAPKKFGSPGHRVNPLERLRNLRRRK